MGPWRGMHSTEWHSRCLFKKNIYIYIFTFHIVFDMCSFVAAVLQFCLYMSKLLNRYWFGLLAFLSHLHDSQYSLKQRSALGHSHVNTGCDVICNSVSSLSQLNDRKKTAAAISAYKIKQKVYHAADVFIWLFRQRHESSWWGQMLPVEEVGEHFTG